MEATFLQMLISFIIVDKIELEFRIKTLAAQN